jgi:hypothetical protein
MTVLRGPVAGAGVHVEKFSNWNRNVRSRETVAIHIFVLALG